MNSHFVRHNWFFLIIFSLLLVKVVWVVWSCWGNGSFDKEKKELIQRRNYLLEKIAVEPRQLLGEMPEGIGLQFQGEWALYSCSMLTEALANMAELYPETKDEAMASIDSLIQIVKSPELRLYDKMRWGRTLLNHWTATRVTYRISAISHG